MMIEELLLSCNFTPDSRLNRRCGIFEDHKLYFSTFHISTCERVLEENLVFGTCMVKYTYCTAPPCIG